jgi:hypothetical protein
MEPGPARGGPSNVVAIDPLAAPENETVAPEVAETTVVADDDNAGEAEPPASAAEMRRRIHQAYLSYVLTDWKQFGAEAVAEVRQQRPLEYMRIVGAILPENNDVEADGLDQLTDEQLARNLQASLRELTASGFDLGLSGRDAAADERAGALPPVSQAS